MSDFENLMSIKMNKYYFSELVKEIRLSRVIPFVGAGISATIYPTWTKYILCITDTFIGDHSIKMKIKEMVNSYKYEEALDYICQVIGTRAFHDHLSYMYSYDKLLMLNKENAIWQLPKIFKETVITTNFDCSLEYVYNECNNPFKDCLYPLHINPLTHRIIGKSHVLVKIHGDIAGHSGIVLTKKQYDEVYGNEQDRTVFVKFLEKFLLSKTLLFIGCSINNDRTIETLKSIIEKYDDVINYAIIELPEDKTKTLERLKFLSELGIRPIWYPNGDHKSVNVIIEELVRRVDIESNYLKNREREILKSLIYSGVEYLHDEAEIVFDSNNKKYHLTFYKTLKVLTAGVDGFSTQFYANKFIGKKDLAEDYYNNNWVDWDALDMRAAIAVYNDTQRESDYTDVIIERMHRTGNYIPFKILFQSLTNKKAICVNVGDTIIIRYSYSVSINFWGSYLNRSSSYFGEKSTVSIIHDKTLKYKIYEIEYDENLLRELAPYEYCVKRTGIREVISLPEKRNGRFRICWDAKEYFGEGENTDVVIDDSKLVRHFL